jgi:hypothetical protein
VINIGIQLTGKDRSQQVSHHRSVIHKHTSFGAIVESVS